MAAFGDRTWGEPDCQRATYVAESAVICGDVVLAEGVSIWPTAVLRGDVERIEIGRNSNVQDGAVLHGDPGQPTILEEDVTVGHRAVIHSANIGAGSLIGIGAIVLNGVQIGAGSIVGAGAVVTKSIPAGSLAMGVPAKVVRSLSAAEIADLRQHAQHYVALAEAHAQQQAGKTSEKRSESAQ
ncbi:gamma carbonic anhydrase family protein [Synechococcus elongatus]|uniref:gamma carbonic anhydrase family protein n=1 Tax=Synechococcus elongatus TaxID=32046 RepID=UPI000F7EABB6|nr:gamma carbonic anhydrase family protein [Synechococcus elongatus]